MSLSLWRFYLGHVRMFCRLPEPLRSPPCLVNLIRVASQEGNVVRVSAPAKYADEYNREFEKLKLHLRERTPAPAHSGLSSFSCTMAALFAIRLLCIGVAWQGSLGTAFIVSLSQFLVAPYSLFVAATQFVALVLPLFLGQVVASAALQLACGALLPRWLQLHAAIDGRFIALFLAADQALCWYCYLRGSSLGPAVQFAPRRVARHVVFGFLNAKTYALLLLVAMRAAGCRVHIIAWALDCSLDLGCRLCERSMTVLRTHWMPLFFHQHRMAHLPRVYEQAHKLHHYLHDCTPFDAHLYGSGLPEEWCLLAFEVAVAVGFGVLPPALSFHVLANDWGNKVGHTRKVDSSDGANHHADHHTLHNKNFGIYNCLLDMYFGTNAPNSDRAEHSGCIITRERVRSGADGGSADTIAFQLTPKPGTGAQSGVQKQAVFSLRFGDLCSALLDAVRLYANSARSGQVMRRSVL